MTKNGAGMPHTDTDALQWLAEQGARFVLPQGRDKKPLYEDWQVKPFDLAQAIAHADRGGNVGLLTGTHSGGIIALDIDRDYIAVAYSLGPYGHTTRVERTNAPDRGKLLYRVDFAVESQSWKPEGWEPEEGEKRSPWSELLSDGRHAVIPPSEYDGGQYVLVNQHAGIATLTNDDLALVWYKATEGRVGLPELEATPDSGVRQPTRTEARQDDAKALVLNAWSTLAVFEYHKLAGEVVKEKNGETRLLGNGGLLIKKNGEGWYSFDGGKGGGDSIAAWAYCTRRALPVTGRAFWDVLREMADAKGLALPDTRPMGQEYPTQPHSNGAVNDADTLALITSVGEASTDNEPEGPHPLDIQPKAGLQLGWIDEYADLMTQMTGAPREFNVLAGMGIAATAIQRRARLRMSFGDIYPNIYGVIIAPSSVYHKSSALAKPRAMLQRAMLDNLLLCELMTSEGLLKQLQGQPAGLVLRDEIGTLFASHNTKYLANLKPDLTALFDCYPYSRRLSNDDIKVQAPYLSILGATTPSRFFEGVSYTDWQDGFLARWLFVMPEKEPDFDAMTGLFTTEHDARLGQLAITLMNIDRQRETDFELVSPAFRLWDAWQRQAAKDAYYYGDDVTAAIVTRYAAYALKFAMILAAVNDSWGTVTPDTMQTAMHLADSFKATVYKLLSEKSNYGVSGAKLQKIFRVIKGKGGTEGITQREIARICSMRKSELTPCMEKLINIGAVITKQIPTKRDGVTMTGYIPAVESLPAKAW